MSQDALRVFSHEVVVKCSGGTEEDALSLLSVFLSLLQSKLQIKAAAPLENPR